MLMLRERAITRLGCVVLAWSITSLLCWARFGGVLPFYPIFNFDLLGPALLACFFRTTAWALHVAAAVIAVAIALAALFFFQSPVDLILHGSVPTLDLLSLFAEYWHFGLLVVLATVAGWLGTRVTHRKDAGWLSILLIFILVTDVLDVSYHFPPSRFGALNIAGSPSLGLVRHRFLRPPHQITPVNDSSRLADQTVSWAKNHPGRQILWVISESLGAPEDPNVMAWLDRTVRHSLPDGYQAYVGTTSFKGATTSAELRQLCALSGGYDRLNSDDASACLPARLSSLGMRTRGLHAFSGRMFQRIRWWPQLGLQQRLFFEDLAPLMPTRRCGQAFRGLCDEDLVDYALRNHGQSGAQFTYLLTLNTHLPLNLSISSGVRPPICQERHIPPMSCTLLAAHQRFLKHLGAALRRRTDKPLVVIVGDHAPPFVDAEERSTFKTDQVPYWVLEPRY
jgi:hypothetical protein